MHRRTFEPHEFEQTIRMPSVDGVSVECPDGCRCGGGGGGARVGVCVKAAPSKERENESATRKQTHTHQAAKLHSEAKGSQHRLINTTTRAYVGTQMETFERVGVGWGRRLRVVGGWKEVGGGGFRKATMFWLRESTGGGGTGEGRGAFWRRTRGADRWLLTPCASLSTIPEAKCKKGWGVERIVWKTKYSVQKEGGGFGRGGG